MSEVRPTYDNEIDLLDLVEILWAGKWKIVAVTIMAALIGVGFSVLKPNSFKVSSPLYNGKPSAFVEYAHLNDLFIKNELDYLITPERVLDLFVSEFNDYDEMIAVLSNDAFVNELVEGLTENQKRKELINLAKSFQIRSPTKSQPNWSLMFAWHDGENGKQLLDDALSLTLDNVKSSIIKDVNGLASLLDNRNRRGLEIFQSELAVIERKQIESDRKTIQYLTEQSAIAKELGIETNRLDSYSLSQTSQNPLSLYVGSNEIPFYLRGFKAIDKEIAIITNRSKDEILLMSPDFVELSEKILALENDLSSRHLKEALEIIKAHSPHDWVEYNLELANSQAQKKSRLYVAISIIIGGLFGMTFVLFSKAMQARKERLMSA